MLISFVALDDAPAAASTSGVACTVDDTVFHILGNDHADVLCASVASKLAAVIDATDSEE